MPSDRRYRVRRPTNRDQPSSPALTRSQELQHTLAADQLNDVQAIESNAEQRDVKMKIGELFLSLASLDSLTGETDGGHSLLVSLPASALAVY